MKKQLNILILFLLSLVVNAQQELITNGGFEEGSPSRPTGWSLEYARGSSAVRDAHSGNYSLQVYGGSRFSAYVNSSFKAIEVEGNTEYTFSYWHKGEFKDPYGNNAKNIIVQFTWYADNKSIKSEIMSGEATTTSPDEWQKKEFKVLAPAGVNKAILTFKIEDNHISQVKIDDISMVFSKKLGEIISVPTNFRYTSYQREIDLFWDNENIDGIKWEVVVDDKEPIFTSENKYTITNLSPQTSHTAKIRAVKGDVFSNFTQTLYFSTNYFVKGQNEINRIPHLRTIADDRSCPKNLPLFYNDLYDLNAKISYEIDGIKTQPEGNILRFPKLGEQTLKVVIEESEDLQWELLYNVIVK